MEIYSCSTVYLGLELEVRHCTGVTAARSTLVTILFIFLVPGKQDPNTHTSTKKIFKKKKKKKKKGRGHSGQNWVSWNRFQLIISKCYKMIKSSCIVINLTYYILEIYTSINLTIILLNGSKWTKP